MSESSLTKREKELLHLIAEGLANKQIACTLCLSENTVEQHLKSIYRKLDVSSRTQAGKLYREMTQK